MELFLAASGIPWIPLELRDGFFDSWVPWLKLLGKKKDLPYCLWCLKTSIFSSNASAKWWCVRDYCGLFCHLPSVFEDLEGSQGIAPSLQVYFTSSVIFIRFGMRVVLTLSVVSNHTGKNINIENYLKLRALGHASPKYGAISGQFHGIPWNSVESQFQSNSTGIPVPSWNFFGKKIKFHGIWIPVKFQNLEVFTRISTLFVYPDSSVKGMMEQ